MFSLLLCTVISHKQPLTTKSPLSGWAWFTSGWAVRSPTLDQPPGPIAMKHPEWNLCKPCGKVLCTYLTHEGNVILHEQLWEFGILRCMTPASPYSLHKQSRQRQSRPCPNNITMKNINICNAVFVIFLLCITYTVLTGMPWCQCAGLLPEQVSSLRCPRSAPHWHNCYC